MTGRLPVEADELLFLDHSADLGGGELSLFDYARTTARTVRVIVFEEGPFVELLRRTGIAVNVLSGGGLLAVRRSSGMGDLLAVGPSVVRAVAKLARTMRRASMVYANSQKALVIACLANIVARRPLIWHLHDIMTAAHFSASMRRVAIGLSNRLATRVIANSAATERSYHDAGGTLPVTVVHNGIDTTPFDMIDRIMARDSLVAELAIPANARIMALFGRLSSWKGQDIAIEAICTLPDAHLVLVGAALFGDAAYEHVLRTLVRDRDLEDRVHFLGFRRDIASLMSAADIIVHCSTSPEPFGRVIAEAMIAGTPVVATAAGGAQEIVDDGRTGILVAPGDVGALSSAIGALLANPVTSAAMAASARVEAIHRFSLAAAVDRTDAVIDATAVVRRAGGRMA